MRKLVTGILSASAAALVLSAPAAFAAGTWTVSGGPNFTASPQSGTVSWLLNETTGVRFFCTSSSISGTVRNGTGLDGNDIATLNSGTFGPCSDINGDTTGNASLSSGSLNAVSFDSGTGTTSGTITGFNVSLAFRGFGTCNVTMAGALNHVTYNNGTLTVTPDTPAALTVTSATGSGCGGWWNTNDKATFMATYIATPTITVTSP